MNARISPLLFLFSVSPLLAEPVPGAAPPGQVGFGADARAEIDELVEEGIAAGAMPGAVVLVGHRGRIVHRQAYGRRQVEPVPEPMTPETLFDLASLTKPIATATSILLLAEQGRIDIQAPVGRYLPEFARNGKEHVTVEQLLIHVSGLPAANPLRDFSDGREQMLERICRIEPASAPGERFVYSDVGYILLGELIERVSGERIDRFAKKHLFDPLDMQATGYAPQKSLHALCAPTEKRNGTWIRGEVHDPRAFALEGVAGHAGLFSTADDLARYARMLLNRGELEGVRVLQAETVQAMFVSRAVPRGIRTWGWDRRTGYSSNRGETMSAQALGHGGFTGTGLWIDPELDLFVIFLSSRLHPEGKGVVNPLIGKIGTVAARAVAPSAVRE